MKRQVLIAIALLTIATSALASWYDDYDAGIVAVRKGQWQVVVQKMSAAIAGNPKENQNTRTYGNIFINYKPYYYRGLAFLRLGQYDKAIADFEKTEGPGEVDRGSIEELMQDAKAKQTSATNVPEPQPVQPTPVPQPVPRPVPAGPVINEALRQQVNNSINAANQSLAAARDRKAAGTAEYRNALNALADANQRLATAKSNEDLQAALGPANNAKLFADSALAPSLNIPQPPPPTTTIVSKPTGATNIVLGDTAKRVRSALENYFNGDFEQAATQFQRLAQEMPKNGWIWAFLGASQYSQYAFEADETYRSAALKSFRKAKQFRSWKGGLPQKYFSKRIRAAFEQG
jgi:tetratricopeptide (TPR) repeat protein